MSAFLSRLSPQIVIGATAVVAVLALGIAYMVTGSRPIGTYAEPRQGALVQEVDTSGTVTAANSLDLSFQVTGRVVYAGPAVGTHVSAGATLASLSNADAAASLEQAEAALEVQQANLDALNAGTRPEDLAVAETAVAGAEATLAQSKESLRAAALDAYVKSDDAIHNKVDQFFNNPRTANATLNLSLSDSQTQNSMISGRLDMEGLLTSWQAYTYAIPSDDSLNVDDVVGETRSNLQKVSAYLDLVATGLTKVIYTTSNPVATVQGYQSTVQTARTNISSDLTALDAAATAEKNAEAALASAQSQLKLKQAGATPQALEAQEAQVAAAQANVDAVRAQVAKLTIVAPISGTITVNNAKIGQIAAPDQPLISLNSDSKFQMESYVSQADLGKLQVGNGASVLLDAYPGQIFTAHVIAIDPAATVQNGVSSYKLTLQFDDADPRVQAGLTGNAKITTKSLPSALAVPTSAIITRGADHFVLRKTGSSDVEVPVTIGISGADGYTEILSGVSSGDQIRTFGNAH